MVDEEIKKFKRLDNSDQVLCMIVDGEPNAAVKTDLVQEEFFPEAAKYDLRNFDPTSSSAIWLASRCDSPS